MEALCAYDEFHTKAIDEQSEEDSVEGKFRRLEFSFNLAQIYAEAGFLSEARAQIEELIPIAFASQIEDQAFRDLYLDMLDYIDPPQGQSSEPEGAEEETEQSE